MTGSAPSLIATEEQAQEDIRGVAEGQSVKLIAATYGLMSVILLLNLLMETVMGG
jgi:hypothetical protein